MDKHKLRNLYVNETGNIFLDDIVKYADWLEEKLIDTYLSNNNLNQHELKKTKKIKSDIVENMVSKGWLNDKPIGKRPLPPKGQDAQPSISLDDKAFEIWAMAQLLPKIEDSLMRV